MKKLTSADIEDAKLSLGKKNNCLMVRRAIAFITRQPDDAIIEFHSTCDWHYMHRQNRSPYYDYEVIGAWGKSPNHGAFQYVIAYKPEGVLR